MNFSYSGNPSSSLHDQVRFLTGDTDSAAPKLSDEEVNFLLAEWEGDVYQAAGAAADHLAATAASWYDYSADGNSMSLTQAQQKYSQMAAMLREQGRRRNRTAPWSGTLNRGEHEAYAADESIPHGSFRLGQTDEPSVGITYGGATPGDLRGDDEPW